MVDNARQLLVKIVVDSANAEKSFKNTADKVDTLKKSSDKASDKIDKLKKSSDNASSKVNDLKKSSDNASDKVTELGAAAKTAGDNAEKASGQVKKLATSTDNASGRFGSLKGSVDSLTQPFKDMSQSLEGVNKLLGLAGISVGLGTVATLLKSAADEASKLRTDLEQSLTSLSTITGKTDTSNLQSIVKAIMGSELGFDSSSVANVVGQVSKNFIGASDEEIQNISQKILVLQKMGTDVDVRKLSDSFESAGINLESVADSIDAVYFAASDTKLTFSEFVDDVERLSNLSDSLMTLEEFYTLTRGNTQARDDSGIQRANADTLLSDNDVRLYGLSSGASIGRYLAQIGSDFQTMSDTLYKATGNDALSSVGAAIATPVVTEMSLLAGNIDRLYSNTIGTLIDSFKDANTGNITINQNFNVPAADSYVVKNAAQQGINASQSRGMKLV